MSNPSFSQISGAVAAAVATNGTITLAYPAGYTSANVKSAGAKLWSKGLQQMFTQGASNFSIAYGGSIVITYLGATSIPAGTTFDFFLPIPDAFDSLTDSSTGTASETIAAFTNPVLSTWNGSSVYPSAAQATAIGAAFTVLVNAVASLAAKQALMQTALKNLGTNPV